MTQMRTNFYSETRVCISAILKWYTKPAHFSALFEHVSNIFGRRLLQRFKIRVPMFSEEKELSSGPNAAHGCNLHV